MCEQIQRGVEFKVCIHITDVHGFSLLNIILTGRFGSLRVSYRFEKKDEARRKRNQEKKEEQYRLKQQEKAKAKEESTKEKLRKKS